MDADPSLKAKKISKLNEVKSNGRSVAVDVLRHRRHRPREAHTKKPQVTTLGSAVEYGTKLRVPEKSR